MANARITNPQFPPRANTNLLGPGPHIIIKGITDGTVRTGDVVVMAPTTRILTQASATNHPTGIIVYSPDYNWGTTTPGRFTVLPANIEVDVCIDGLIEANSDASDIDDSQYIGYTVACKATGLIECPPTAGQFPLGILMDLRAGNTGTGTGAADGDPIAIKLSLGGQVHA